MLPKFLFAALQYLVTFLSSVTKGFWNIVTSPPLLMVYKGCIFKDARKEERVIIEELPAKARKHGFSGTEDINDVIPETNGRLTVIEKLPGLEVENLNGLRKAGTINQTGKK